MSTQWREVGQIPWETGIACEINVESMASQVRHLQRNTIYMVEEFTREVWLDFCDDWGPHTRAVTMVFLESAWARGNSVYCRHTPGGRFQYVEIARDVVQAMEDRELLVQYLETDSAWSVINEDYKVHTIDSYLAVGEQRE